MAMKDIAWLIPHIIDINSFYKSVFSSHQKSLLLLWAIFYLLILGV